ncbi:MAG: ParB N-terminal domain-containing protein [Bacteroidota bacterium]
MGKIHPKLEQISPVKISFDPHNPRGLTEAQIVSTPEFNKLLSSIKDHGVLVPLIIKPNELDSASYILIDGERRLRAVKKADISKVPALVAKDDADGRVLAYHAHMLFYNWDKAAETKAIKRIIEDLKSKNPNITDSDIKKELKEITAHTEHELSDIMKLCNYDEEIINMVVSGSLDMSYLIQIESSFISPLKRNYPDIMKNYGEGSIRKILIQRAIDGKLVKTRYLMDTFKVVFQDEKHKVEVEQLLVNFLNDKAKSIKTTFEEYETLTKPNIKKTKGRKVPTKKQKRSLFEYKSIKVSKEQQTLMHEVREKFEKIGNSFSGEEREYIGEALHCLEQNCFKAAILMIWAAGVSRILMHIGKNLTDFNKATEKMATNPALVYRHFARNFQKNAETIDEVRVNSNDRHLFSYLYHKEVIGETDCKKLFANYDTRCACAHPTDITLPPNDVISIFDNIYNLVFTNNINLK